MNVSTSLLVILMFTSIVGIGIANILMAFAEHISTLSKVRGRSLGAAWLLIILLSYLGMFWNSTLIVEREDWLYTEFLFVVLGPILLLFSSSLMIRLLARDPENESDDVSDHTLPRFFLIYACVQGWFIGMDYILFDMWSVATTLSFALLIAAACLAFVKKQSVVWGFTAVILTLSIIDIVLR